MNSSKCVFFLFITKRKICQPLYLYNPKNDLIVNCAKKSVDIRQNILTWRDDLMPTWSLDWDFSYRLWYPTVREKYGIFYDAPKHLFSKYFWYVYVCDFRIILRGRSNSTIDKWLCKYLWQAVYLKTCGS